MITHRTTCRDCGRDLDTVLNLGDLRISTFPDPAVDVATLPTAPIHLVQCVRCGLVQLADTVDPERLFGEVYWYRSGINETMVAELQDVVKQALQYAAVARGSLVLDLGANDGTLLRQYAALGRSPYRIGVEPSLLARDLSGAADEIVPRFFPDADLIAEFAGTVRVITAIACLYDVDDPHAFVEGVRRLLAPGGVWIVQVQDLAQMLSQTAVDNLCHEHLCYYSLAAIERLISPHDLVVVHAERRPINGGSLRLVIRHKADALVSPSVGDCRKLEEGCEQWETLSKFSWRVDAVRRQIPACLRGTPVDLYGASTKANTLLQICGLGSDQIRQAWERSPAKWGQQTVTGIPIVSEEDGRADPPMTLLCGIWQYRAQILQREAAYVAQGGLFLFPLPLVEIVTGAREAV